VVGAKDLQSPTATGLTATWKGFRLDVKEPSGIRTLTAPGVVAAGAELSMTIHSVSRTFPLGSSIVISAQDLVDIGSTFILFANELEVAIDAWQNELVTTDITSLIGSAEMGSWGL
jgi:3D (Asp-Asp-Asp) domain-containing protein